MKTAVLSAQLPAIHGDPCDRFIVALAKIRSMTVVTVEERFAAYGIGVIE